MDFVEQLKSSVDIVKVVGQYVRLRKSGPTRYTGLCPFHNEKTPSFTVHTAHQFYKCFGCGAGGDVLKFVMEIDRLSFYEALKLLAETHGIPMPKRSEYSDPETKLRAAIYQAHELAAAAFRELLMSAAGAEARAYIGKRGISAETAGQFGLGYADRSGRFLVRLLEKQGFTAEQLETSGLVSRRDDGTFYDRFRGRLMFPIHNESGRVIGFGGRSLAAEDEPRYLNSPETPIYRKSHVLYNLHRAKDGIRRSERTVLVEGYMDVIGVTEAGIREVVASCGTALTAQQVQIMKRHSPNVVMNFDPDLAGSNAAERSIQLLLEEGMHVRVLELDGGLDPDEYCRQNGRAAYESRLNAAKNYFYWLADRARVKFDMRSAEGRVAAFQFLLPSIQRISDKLERVAWANDVAGYLGVDAGLVLENFRRAAAGQREKRITAAPEPVTAVERILLNLMLLDAEAREKLLPELRSMAVVQRFHTRRIFESFFAMTDSGGAVGFRQLEARLEEDDRGLLASIVLADATNAAELSLEQGEACLQALAQAEREFQKAALRARVKEAERAGNLSEAMRLIEELGRTSSN